MSAVLGGWTPTPVPPPPAGTVIVPATSREMCAGASSSAGLAGLRRA